MSKPTKITEAFNQSTERFHVIATWIGLSLNLIWWVSDLIILPGYSFAFLLFRLFVSLSSLFILLFRKKIGVNIYFCMFFLVSGISVQNAFMWSVMDVQHFQQHAFAYIVLFIGVGMLVLWSFRLSMILLALTVVSNILFLSINSQLTFQEIMINGGLLTLTVVIFCAFLIRSRYRLIISEISIRLDLEESKREIELQKEMVDDQNRNITDSIHYARTIQQAILPTLSELDKSLAEHFVLYLPKNIVSGDFYWIHQSNNKTFFVAGDCTGHGVPGGFMTMLGLSFLEEIVSTQKNEDPGTILNLLRDKVITALNQKGFIGESKDGMDIALFVLDKDLSTVEYAGAYNNLYIYRNQEIITLKAMRQPCGYSHVSLPFRTECFPLEKGDVIYTMTDGFSDQFGGGNGKKFRTKNTLQLFMKHKHLPMSEQRVELLKAFEKWRGALEQVDDVLVMGVQV